MSKSIRPFLICGMLLIALSAVQAQQRITYEQLARQQREESIFIDNFTLPGSTEGTVRFVTTFRVDYKLLPFRKTNDSSARNNFLSPVSMSMEVFRNDNPENQGNRRERDFTVKGLEPVDRSFWRDTAYAESYEETQSKNRFINGYLLNEMQPGTYSYILQFIRGQEVNGQFSRKRTVKILPYSEKKSGNVVLLDNYTGESSPEKAQLLNFGNNVYYGRDFFALIHLPKLDRSDNYRLSIHQIEIQRQDTTKKNSVYNTEIDTSDILRDRRPKVESDGSAIYLSLENSDRGEDYLLVKIPNSRFPNDVYQLQVLRNNQNTPVARKVFRSRWIEMPTSLLNVDIAIEMLRFIESEKTIERLKKGSNADKEQKFREFWNKRDPTPNTEFNELMAEYYRRIDYAYEQFSTVNVSGYSTDQGRIYIRFGPPNSIDRKFPPGEPAVEIWNYDNRTFVFRAVSGFGQFELVSSG